MFLTRCENLKEFYDELHNALIGLIGSDEEFEIQDTIREETDNFYFQAKDIYNQLSPKQVTTQQPNPNPNRNNNSDYRDILKLDIPIFYGTCGTYWTHLGRLNTSIRTAFVIEHSKIKFPSYQNLTKFLNNHCRALESVQITPNTSHSQKLQQTFNSHPNFRKQQNYNQYQKHPSQSYVSNIAQNKQSSQNTQSIRNKSHSFNSHSTPNIQIALSHNSNPPNSNSQRNFNSPIQYKCRLCNQNSHNNLSQCHMFIAKNINDRIAYVKQNNVCLNCLRFSHTENSCQSNFASRLCGERHLSTLHISQVISSQPHFSSNSQNAQNNSTPTSYESSNDQFLNCGCTPIKPSKPQTTVLLSTTNVDILDARGYYHTVRVEGINQSSSTTNGITNCTIKPLNKTNPVFTFELFVLPKVCAEMPSIQVNTQNWHHISNLELADDKFKIPAPVDILLGAQPTHKL
nr:unnamed protein product [Callosobruchus analis]